MELPIVMSENVLYMEYRLIAIISLILVVILIVVESIYKNDENRQACIFTLMCVLAISGCTALGIYLHNSKPYNNVLYLYNSNGYLENTAYCRKDFIGYVNDSTDKVLSLKSNDPTYISGPPEDIDSYIYFTSPMEVTAEGTFQYEVVVDNRFILLSKQCVVESRIHKRRKTADK